jgi:phospholipid transport system substrate-binding protein
MFRLIFLTILLYPQFLWAADAPREVIQTSADQLIELIDSHRSSYKTQPAALQGKMNDLMNSMIDSNSFSRGVMGKHYASIPESGRDQFQDVLMTNLVQTLADGLVALGEFDVEVHPSITSPKNASRASVKTTLNAASGDQHDVVYSMALSEDVWQVRNVVFDGINLGKSFRSQFDHAFVTHQHNVEQVSAEWKLLASDEL